MQPEDEDEDIPEKPNCNFFSNYHFRIFIFIFNFFAWGSVKIKFTVPLNNIIYKSVLRHQNSRQ